tara:strand:+ start:1248 stop:2666 length:1419 start_codon:yes stop_codon:yes gene_type:complete
MVDIVPDIQGIANTLEPFNKRSSLTGFSNIRLTDYSGAVSVSGPQTRDIPLTDSKLVKGAWYRLTESQTRQLKLDPTITLVRELLISPAIATPWTVEEKEGAPKGAKEALQQAFFPHRLTLIQNAFFGCIDRGWAPFEVVWGLDHEQRIVPVWFKQLLHEWTDILVYVNTGKFFGFVNAPIGMSDMVTIGPDQALNFNLEVEGTDWYGISSLGKVYSTQKNWLDVNNSANAFDQKIAGAHWIIYYPVGQTPFGLPGETKEVKDNAEIAKIVLSTLEANGSTAIPDEVQEWMDDDIDKTVKGKWRVELLSAGSNINAQFTDRLKYLDNLKVRAFGIPERAILEAKFGTKADAEAHADAGISNIDRKHRLIVDQINSGPVNSFLRFNYGEKFENSMCLQVSPLIDARFSLLKDAFSRILQNGDALSGMVEIIDVRAVTEELGIPLQPGTGQLEMSEPEPAKPFEGDESGLRNTY